MTDLIRARARQIVAVTLASLALSTTAYAQQPGTPAKDPQPAGEAAFARADTDKDGKLTKAESARLPAIAARFEELDKNKDGFLSLEEFMTGYTAK